MRRAVGGRGAGDHGALSATADPARGLRLRVLLVAGVCYAWLLTRRSLDPFGAEEFGLAFNSMLDHLLHGRWDVDPAAIGFEAFLRDGRAYAYFGPVPALLRLPLLVLPEWRALHVERLSCWLAIMVGIVAQSRAVMGALANAAAPIRQRLGPPLIVVCAISGPPMLSWRGALIYHESILWAWALAMVFVALALPAIVGAGPLGWRRLCGLGACAGLCVLTRVTTGVGLLGATALLLGLELVRHRGGWRLLVPAGVVGAFVGLIGTVNQGRWGNPLVFADLRLQTYLMTSYPDRLLRMQRHGLFDVRRIDIGLLYYVLPVWTDSLERLTRLRTRLLDWYDAIEAPASSLLLTDPVWCVLAVLGLIALVRRRATIGGAMLAGGTMLAPLLMLMAWYLAFRYRVEFSPMLIVLACIGLADRAPRLPVAALGRVATVLSVLCVVQVANSMIAGWAHGRQEAETTPDYAAFSLACTFRPASCLTGAR